jgi:hypothetical protein
MDAAAGTIKANAAAGPHSIAGEGCDTAGPSARFPPENAGLSGKAAGLLVKSTAVPARHRFSLQVPVAPASNE